ncbi:MAG TPA: DUF3089 domain-containing protein [Aquihabitans sp.]|jgi:hypothetical protein|nr:DUF3089 domain-containing protein [Aquihabitans sp.]
MRTTGTTTRAAALALAGLLLLAGCSSDDDAGPATTAAAGEEATTTSAAGDDAGGGDAPGGGEPLERYADHESESYDDPTHWVCRPDVDDDPCDGDLDATVIEADGSTSVERFEPVEDAPVDCFYVYPTISRDATAYSDWEASDEEEGFVTVQQAARLGSACRVFAPIYRQTTLTALTTRMGGGTIEGAEDGDPFADVLDAFRTYMAQDNGGRGVVLIGHSQGAGMLNELIRTEIDPNEDVRELLVGAYLAGGAVAVPEGEVVGGDFQEVPLCTADDETGCVTTWATFRSTEPPPANSYFGRVREGDGVAGCVNPAAVGGGDVDLRAYFPADASASILSTLGAGQGGERWLSGPEGEAIDTPFVTLPGLVSGTCATTDGFNYLSVTVHPDPADPRADDISGDLTPEWGLHLVDVSVVMGDIVARVEDQIEAYTA